MTDARPIDAPAPGFWRFRLRRDGPFVAARIRRVTRVLEPGNPLSFRDCDYLDAEIDGEPCSVMDVWLRAGEPISEKDFNFMVRDSRWVKMHAPDDPKANPRKAVDWANVSIKF